MSSSRVDGLPAHDIDGLRLTLSVWSSELRVCNSVGMTRTMLEAQYEQVQPEVVNAALAANM